jgi:hypothetical protein
VLNREDPRVARIAATLTGPQEVLYFGLDDSLLGTFPNDDELRAAPGSPAPAGTGEARCRRRTPQGGRGQTQTLSTTASRSPPG